MSVVIHPYRPSSGTEGAMFMERFCDLCQRDAGFRTGTDDGCIIAAATMVYEITDPEYPKEWVRRGNTVECTAFEPQGDAAPATTDGQAGPGLTTDSTTKATL